MSSNLRRNGKQQACEPCRKQKVSCDHTTPHCGRCVRKGIAPMCIYHPAPMTRGPTSKYSSGIYSRKEQPQSPNIAPPELSRVSQQPPMAQSSSFMNRSPASYTTSAGRRLEGEASAARPTKYYGPMSFSSIFTENDLLDADDDRRRVTSPWALSEGLLGPNSPSSPTVRMNQVIAALWHMPSKSICDSFLSQFDPQYHVLMNSVMIERAVAGLWSVFGDQLSAPRSSEKLSAIAEAMFNNEERALPLSPDDGTEWLNTFTGDNLRFETMALVFCFFGFAYHTLLDGDYRFSLPESCGRDRKEAGSKMKECADICLKMCEISETNNEISVAAMLCTLILESLCTGDESFQLRRRLADMVVNALAAGLHRLDVGANTITTALEYKRRVIASIYCIDKNESLMNGVPFSLSYKFTHLRLPLDISEQDLFLPKEELIRVADQLGPNGWNKSGRIYRATLLRAIVLISKVREQILELALSVDLAINPQQIDDLLHQCQLEYNSLPPHIHYYEYGTTPKNSTGKVLLDQAYVMLLYLQNRLLIDRVATVRGFGNDQRLLDTAMELLELTIMYWIKRDDLVAFYNHFDWVVTCFGIPSSGVICVELLKQAKGQSQLKFSRSDAIRNLSMFICFLEWIRPTDPNYLLMGRLKAAVKKVIDHVLDPPEPQQPHPPQTQGAMDANIADFSLDPMMAPLDPDTVDWLNAIDWTQGPWIELNV